MVVHPEFIEDEKPQPPTPQQQNPNPKPFNSNFDQSNPFGFLESVFKFVSKKSNFFELDASEGEFLNLIKKLKEKKKMKEREALANKKNDEKTSASGLGSGQGPGRVKEPVGEDSMTDDKEKSMYKVPNNGHKLLQ